MKHLTATEATRLGLYTLAALVGAFVVVWGIIHKDTQQVALGLGLLVTGGTAAPNVNRTKLPALPGVDDETLPVQADSVKDAYADDGEGETVDLHEGGADPLEASEEVTGGKHGK